MSDFKAKNAPNLLSAGALSQISPGELSVLSQTLKMYLRDLLKKEARGRKGKGEGRGEKVEGGIWPIQKCWHAPPMKHT